LPACTGLCPRALRRLPHEYLLAFACSRGGFCPSCAAKRGVIFGASNPLARVLAGVPRASEREGERALAIAETLLAAQRNVLHVAAAPGSHRGPANASGSPIGRPSSHLAGRARCRLVLGGSKACFVNFPLAWST